MPVKYCEQNRIFHLRAGDSSYIMQISESGYLQHCYWGKKVTAFHPSVMPVSFARSELFPAPDNRVSSLDLIRLEYPVYGNSDFRTPAFSAETEGGLSIYEPKYKSYRIYRGKPILKGLPATYTEDEKEADTLEIKLKDELTGTAFYLLYTAFAKRNVITRSVKIRNEGDNCLNIDRIFSASIDFAYRDFDIVQLEGAYNREHYIVKHKVFPGLQISESRRGSSSHQASPFFALSDEKADEKNGNVFAFQLVYSGNFAAGTEKDQFGITRAFIGINPFDFSWQLKPKEVFIAPEAILVYSDCGYGNMSRTFHDLLRERLCRGKFRDIERPVLVNNWEATHFDFNQNKIMSLAEKSAKLGIELLVLDDGWFGKRNDDTSSLGDWKENKDKLPDGLSGIAKKVNHMGMRFGLWVEPEMISPDSDLYRRHPDWCIHVDGRYRSLSRHQLVLDLTRKKIRNELIHTFTGIFHSVPISYVKWDMNRNITERGSNFLPKNRQKEFWHRYILGLYEILEKIIREFPDILFESSASGGGRFDPGMLYYMPQTWASDNTDGIDRLKIQYGSSFVYPAITIGAHVSGVPNQQIKRMTSLKLRGDCAMSCNFGYELDLGSLSDIEKKIIIEQIKTYKQIRHLIQFGDLYRLISPFDHNEAAWMYVSKDKSSAYAFYFHIQAEANPGQRLLRLDGLDPNSQYQNVNTKEIFGGDELMHAGIFLPLMEQDYESLIWNFVRSHTVGLVI